jgi:hypothetical protein
MTRVRASRGFGIMLAFALCMSAAARVRADQTPGHERIDFTAYTLHRNEVMIGLGSAAYGVLDQLTIGTYVLPWFAFPWLHAPIATGYLKLRDWFAGPVSVSLRGTVAYLNASALSSELSNNASMSAGVLIFPVELSVSWRIAQAVSQSVQVTWVHAAASGQAPSDTNVDFGLGGASTATSASLSTLTELRLTRVFALSLRGTLLLGMSHIVVNADYERNGTRVNARLGATPRYPSVVGNLIPGVAFSWSHVNLQLGLGFGSNWLPIIVVPTQRVTLVPDADFYVRF